MLSITCKQKITMKNCFRLRRFKTKYGSLLGPARLASRSTAVLRDLISHRKKCDMTLRLCYSTQLRRNHLVAAVYV